MELDNLFYIILIVFLFVISLLGQFRKSKAVRPKEPESEEEAYSLNDFEKILERKQEYLKTDEDEQPVEESIDEDKSKEFIHESDLLKHSKTSAHKKEESEISDGFDFKSAIVYSSILERKKFRR